jgi:hypothetical protein
LHPPKASAKISSTFHRNPARGKPGWITPRTDAETRLFSELRKPETGTYRRQRSNDMISNDTNMFEVKFDTIKALPPLKKGD